MLTHSSPVRSKQFSFKPNYVMKSSQFADPTIVSILMTLGDQLRNHKLCEEAVISTNNHSAELALKWMLQRIYKRKKTPLITQSTTRVSPILVAISPKCSPSRKNNKNNPVLDDLMESMEYNNYLPPLSIGKTSFNEEDALISPTTTITITPIHNTNSNRSLLSPITTNYINNIPNISNDEAEIIAMSPITPFTDTFTPPSEGTPTPHSFAINTTTSPFTSAATTQNILHLCENNLNLILQFLSTKHRIMCSLLCKFMNDLVFHNCNFDDTWLTFGNYNGHNNMRLIKAKSISERYYKNCIQISIKCIQFVDNYNNNNDSIDFNNILTRSRRSNNNHKVVRFSNINHAANIENIENNKSMPKYEKRLSSPQLNNCWIWKYLHCLELNSNNKMDYIFNSFEWDLLCKYKLSKSIFFLSFDMYSNILNPDNFNLISSYFSNLQHLNLSNFAYFDKYKDIILEFFKLKHNDIGDMNGWEKVESSLVKLKGIEFNKCDANIVKLLAHNINYEVMTESLFTQLIALQINKCVLSNIIDLQLILNGCINIKYLNLCYITISIATDLESDINNIPNKKFTDRVERHKEVRKKSIAKSKHYQIEQLNGIPIIKIPKTVKYIKIYHTFGAQNILYNDDGDGDEDEYEYDEYDDSTNSTPVLFAMDDVYNSPKKKPVKNKNKNKNNVYPLSLPPFYCNLSACRQRLIEANVEINDAFIVDQLFVNNMQALKHVILNYSSQEHNRYLNFTEFCAFYSNLYENWTKIYSKNIKIILNNSLYDEFKLSVNKIKGKQFFKTIFNKNENEIVKEQQFSYLDNRFNIKSNSENIFVNRLLKCTDFFQSRITNNL